MATYAAMIDCVDQNVGKIIKSLKELGVYENTLILFLHDNGGCDEGGPMGRNSGGKCGTAESVAYYGKCWANVSNTPFQKYKKYIHEGGISSPLIAHWPGGIPRSMNGKIATQPTHLIDIMASVVDVSGATYPETYKGHKILPMEGESLLPVLQSKPWHREAPIFFEHMGNRGLRQGNWKLVAIKGKPWELYDVESDRTELHDLATEMPEKVEAMSALYDAWAKRAFVRKARNNAIPITLGKIEHEGIYLHCHLCFHAVAHDCLERGGSG